MKKNIILILCAGTLWGFMGLFVRALAGIGINSTGAVMVRCAITALCFAVTILIKDRRLFKVKLKDFWCFIGTGILSMLFFSYCYFNSMNYIDLSAAAILLYTAPAIVIILSLFIFHEKLTAKKIFAVLLAFIGCCLVSGIGGDTRLSGIGVLLGLGAGFGYALYSIFAKLALEKGYNSITINFYSCFLAAVGACLIWSPAESFTIMFASAKNIALCVACGVVSCYMPYLLYTYGLKTLETGKASIMASVEPVVATIVGVVIYHEKLTILGAAGIVLVLSAIVILNVNGRKNIFISKISKPN